MGVSSIHLETSSLHASHNNQQRNHCVVRLLTESSVVVLVVAFGWWGMWNLGSLTAQPEPIYVAGCPVPDPLEKSSHEGSTHPITSRQPGVGLGGQAHGAERHRDDRVPPLK